MPPVVLAIPNNTLLRDKYAASRERMELVQEQPYNHTADLWCLGVILCVLRVSQIRHTYV